MKVLRILPLFLVSGLGGPVLADEDTTLTEQDWLLDELPTVLSGSRLAQSVANSPVAVAVIDRQMIEAAGVREVQELLRLAPGMLVHHDNGHHATVTYRALASTYARRILVLVDGRPAYSPVISWANWTMLPLTLAEIERIEIIRGPNAAVYGANAFLGVINVITRRPHLSQGVNAHLTRGNNGIYRALATVGASHGNLDWRISIQGLGDHGIHGPLTDQDDKHTRIVSGRADWLDARGGSWELYAGYTHGRRDHGGPNSLLRPPHDIRSRNAHAQLRWTSSDDVNDNHRLNVFWTRDGWTQEYFTLPIPEVGGLTGFVDQSVDSHRHEIEYTRTMSPGPRLRSVWGAAARLDRFRSQGYLGRQDTLHKSSYRLFTHHEYRFDQNWVANAGVMFEHDENAGSELSPRLALNWTVAPGQTVRLAYSTATRTPTIVEESADSQLPFAAGIVDQMLLASGNLSAERIRSREIGWILSMPEHSLTLDARVANDRIDRLITYYFIPFPDLDGIAQDFRNMDAMTLRGFEFQVDWRPVPAARLMFNYAYTDIEATDIDELYSASGPRHVWSAFASIQFNRRWSGSLIWYRIGAMQGMNTGNFARRTERADLRVSYELRLGDSPARLSFVIQEPIGDLRDFRTRNAFHRRWFVDLHTSF
jgi:iron complex outermembrane recepter protein